MGYITNFSIKRFKSLADFSLTFARGGGPTCLVGLNGAGKSTVLHALDFVGQLFRGDIQGWLKARSWNKTDILTRPIHSRTIEASVTYHLEQCEIIWTGSYNSIQQRCTEENIKIDGKDIFSVRDRKLFFAESKTMDIIFEYEGSVLSQISKNVLLSEEVLQFYSFMQGVHSFDMLNPKQLRTRGRKFQSNNIGMGGEHLAGLLASIPRSDTSEIVLALAHIFPWIGGLKIKSLRAGWQELHCLEKDFGYVMAQHCSDGVMRLLALITEMYSSDSFIMFDEIENGFNPAVIHGILKLLKEAQPQVLITSHNPLILNALVEDGNTDSVLLLYKRDKVTHAQPLFELSEAKERLEYMHAGEVFLDIDIEAMLEKLYATSSSSEDRA